MVKIIASSVSYHIHSDHPKMGESEYPYFSHNYNKAVAIHEKIVSEGYRSELVMSQTVTTETIIIHRNNS